MFNQSTLVLGYLLLYGYDVSGHAYQMRLFGLAAGALLVCAVFYGNHRAMPMSFVQETSFLLSICAIRAPNGSFARLSAFRSYFSSQS